MTSIFDKALAFLVRREHSEKELWQKLSLKFPEQSEEISDAIGKLKAMGYLSNERFIESRVRHRLAQGYGTHRVLAELTQMHGLSAEDIKPYLSDGEKEMEQLKILIEKKFKALDLQDFAVRNKVIAYCLRRGFPLQAIKAVLHEVD